jgi:protein NrfD
MTELEVARALPPPAWGWEIPVYLFLGGMAAGLMIVQALMTLRGVERSAAGRWLAFAPLALVSVGMAALFLDLEGKARVFRFYLAMRWSSPMSWGAWILLAVYPVSLLAAVGGLEEGQRGRLRGALGRLGLGRAVDALWRSSQGRALPLAWASLAAGTALGVYTGVLLSSLGAKALWASSVLGPLFLVSGASTGAAFLLLFKLGEAERRHLARFDVAALGVEALLLGLFVFGLARGGAAAKQAVAVLLTGPYAPAFVGLVLVAGLAVPLALAIFEHRRHLHPTRAAPALVLCGGLSLRWILVAAGQG